MIVVCTHKSPQILDRILSSIRNFSTENHKILVVETSDSDISKNVADQYNCLFTNTDLKYEIGAYNHAMDIYPDEDEYFMFQDSIEILKFGWEDAYRELSKCNELYDKDQTPVKMVTVCGYPLIEDPCPGCGVEIFESLYNLPFPAKLEAGWAVGCNCFYIPQIGKQMLKQFGVSKLTANDKNDTYGTERILGAIAFYSCGLEDVSKILGYWAWDGKRYLPETGFTQYVYKHMQHRQ